MKRGDIIHLGTSLGLKFDARNNYIDQLDKDAVVFDGCNGQRFRIDGQNMSDVEIYAEFGRSLIMYGRRLQKMDIHNALNIMSDF